MRAGGTGEKMSEDSTVIYVTRPLWGLAPAGCTDEYLENIGTPMHRGIPKEIERDGKTVAICNTFCVDGYVSGMRLQAMLNMSSLTDRYYIEMWTEDGERDMTEHLCLGFDGRGCVPSAYGYESFTTSEHPEVTPEYLTEDYAVAFIDGLTTREVLDVCSFTCRKW